MCRLSSVLVATVRTRVLVMSASKVAYLSSAAALGWGHATRSERTLCRFRAQKSRVLKSRSRESEQVPPTHEGTPTRRASSLSPLLLPAPRQNMGSHPSVSATAAAITLARGIRWILLRSVGTI